MGESTFPLFFKEIIVRDATTYTPLLTCLVKELDILCQKQELPDKLERNETATLFQSIYTGN